MRRTALTLLMCAPLAFAACGDDADANAADGVLDVTLSDYSFGDVPDEVAAGTPRRSTAARRTSSTAWSTTWS